MTDTFDFDAGNPREKLMWCIGFGLGDGTDIKVSKDKYSISIRICGTKSRFVNYFKEAGLNVTEPI